MTNLTPNSTGNPICQVDTPAVAQERSVQPFESLALNLAQGAKESGSFLKLGNPNLKPLARMKLEFGSPVHLNTNSESEDDLETIEFLDPKNEAVLFNFFQADISEASPIYLHRIKPAQILSTNASFRRFSLRLKCPETTIPLLSKRECWWSLAAALGNGEETRV